MPTKIEWADEVWNVVTGCTKISPGCKNCYAEGMVKRFGHRGNIDRNNIDKDFSHVVTHLDRMAKPNSWKKPRFVFVCSMGDLFHEDVPFDFIMDVETEMRDSELHTFLLLTKRPDRAARYIAARMDPFSDNVWLGVSVEDQKTADERISILLKIPAMNRFVSVEPILEKIDIAKWLFTGLGLKGLDWVIAGCESGPRRRPAKIDWFRSLRDQCVTAKVPFFLKQVGGNPYVNEKPTVIKMPKIDGQAWNQRPAD